MNNGVSGGEGRLSRRRWSAETPHAGSPAAAMVVAKPCRKGSVLEAGRVKKSWSGRLLVSLGLKVIDLRMAWQLAEAPAAH